MEIIEWNESLSVKNYLIDSQHKKLIALMNSLIDSFNEEKKKGHLQPILDDFVSSVRQHFSSEERILKKANFIDYEEHKSGHDKLLEKVLSFQELYRKDKLLLSSEVMEYLRNWLIHHVEDSDSEFRGLI